MSLRSWFTGGGDSDHDENGVSYWRIYAGEALTSPDADPLEVLLDTETSERLHCGDSDPWRMLLSLVAVEDG